MRLLHKFVLAVAIATAGLAGCTTNPVTGKSNFQLYDTGWEREVGSQMYAPMKQSQGGEFILDPELTEYVSSVGNRLAARSRREGEFEYEFSLLNSSVPNAWALPGGKIVINRGLLIELESEAELAAVLGHEIVHADASHGARAQSKGVLTQAGAMISMVVLGSQIENQQAREIAMIVPQLGAQMLTQKYGRDAERESDEYGMRYMSEAGYDPQGAIELQKTFVELSEGRNEDWLSGLFASHPPSPERVENNRKTAKSLPEGGEIGRERFHARTAYLRRVQPAYEAFDEAKKALAEDKPALAQEKLNRSLAIEPREAQFHQLQGDLYALDGKTRKALTSYDRSISQNPEFFYGYLRQGQMRYKLDRFNASRTSLEESLELMPTAEAHYLLGMMDKKQGNTASAMEHFQTAAQSNSETGKKAANEVVLVDLENNPSNYIATRPAADKNGRVWAQFLNRTGVAVRDIEISYAWLDGQGQTRQGRKVYRGPLEGGKQAEIALGVTVPDAASLSRRVQVQVTSARIAR
jgi:predicted Zn-dependent protease